MDLTQLTPAELDKLTKAELIAAILEDLTYSDVNLAKDKFGNNVELTETMKDAYGVVVGGKTVRWTYYGDGSTGEVNEIITEDGKEIATVKHTLDGKQPTLKRVLIAEPILREL